MPLAGTLALIATLCNFVPYIGAISGAVPAVLVALGQGGACVRGRGLFLVVQGFEGNVVAPLVQRRTVELPPVLTIFSQTIFGSLFGPLGLVLATPIAAALMVAVRIVYVEGVLGEPPSCRNPLSMPSFARPTSRFFISHRLRLHYVEWGDPDAPPLLLLHGGRDHCRNWDWVAARLLRPYPRHRARPARPRRQRVVARRQLHDARPISTTWRS